MAIHPRAGQPAQQDDLINIGQLVSEYYVLQPDPKNAAHAVQFGTLVIGAARPAIASTKPIFWLLRKLLLKCA